MNHNNEKRKSKKGLIILLLLSFILLLSLGGITLFLAFGGQNNNTVNNTIDDVSTGVNIVESRLEIGIGESGSGVLHWVYFPFNSTPSAEPSSVE